MVMVQVINTTQAHKSNFICFIFWYLNIVCGVKVGPTDRQGGQLRNFALGTYL